MPRRRLLYHCYTATILRLYDDYDDDDDYHDETTPAAAATDKVTAPTTTTTTTTTAAPPAPAAAPATACGTGGRKGIDTRPCPGPRLELRRPARSWLHRVWACHWALSERGKRFAKWCGCSVGLIAIIASAAVTVHMHQGAVQDLARRISLHLPYTVPSISPSRAFIFSPGLTTAPPCANIFISKHAAAAASPL